MFLKAFKQKSNAALKGSEVKRLRQRVEKAFPNASAEQLTQLLPSVKTMTQLRLVTHSGFQTNVFCVDKLPIFFEIENSVLVPTLYAMWQIPELLPHFTTHDAVLPRLANGADLMLPGVIPQGCGMQMYGRYKKDQLVGVNLVSNKATVGIGMLCRSSDDLYMCGGQGSAVKMLHLFGDKLWSLEPALTQQVPNMRPEPLTKEDFPELGAVLKKPMASGTASTPAPQEQMQSLFIHENASGGSANTVLESNEEMVQPADAARENDSESTKEDLLKKAFLAALKNNGKSLQLPLLTSTFYRQYMLPEISESVDIKKTKYKKLLNFLQEMVDQNFIVVREETKGVYKITSIDHEHPELVNFITDYKQPSTTDGEGADQPLFHSELTEMYVVTDATASFFTKLNYKRGEGIPVIQIKKIAREYVNKMNLSTDPITKAIKLDDTLREICECDEASLSNICNTLTTKMEHSFQMCSRKDVANKPLIQMSLATRSGNKKVTLVSNIECYGIILPEFIKLCKQGAAASTAIVKVPNQKREVLQVQGNQVRFIFNLLTETYKVPPKCILGLNLAKDEKKHKKK